MLNYLQISLVNELNRLINDPNFYDKNIFTKVKLTEKMSKLTGQRPTGEALIRLNRLLLECIYPNGIAKSRKNYLDIHNPNDLKIIKNHLDELKREVDIIIIKKLTSKTH
jgi:hypothetical protein